MHRFPSSHRQVLAARLDPGATVRWGNTLSKLLRRHTRRMPWSVEWRPLYALLQHHLYTPHKTYESESFWYATYPIALVQNL